MFISSNKMLEILLYDYFFDFILNIIKAAFHKFPQLRFKFDALNKAPRWMQQMKRKLYNKLTSILHLFQALSIATHSYLKLIIEINQ